MFDTCFKIDLASETDLMGDKLLNGYFLLSITRELRPVLGNGTFVIK